MRRPGSFLYYGERRRPKPMPSSSGERGGKDRVPRVLRVPAEPGATARRAYHGSGGVALATAIPERPDSTTFIGRKKTSSSGLTGKPKARRALLTMT